MAITLIAATRNFHLQEIAMSPVELTQRVREQAARKEAQKKADAEKVLTYRGVAYRVQPKQYCFSR